MDESGFVVAMAGLISVRANSRTPASSLARWLIVSVCGVEAQYLTIAISQTGFDRRSTMRRAPVGIAPAHTVVAVPDPHDGCDFCFRLVRACPASLSVAGRFCPLDGSVGLDTKFAPWSLSGSGLMAVDDACGLTLGLPLAKGRRCGAGLLQWDLYAYRVPWDGDRVVAGRHT